MNKVSIITPCYNHGQYLTEAIESVLAQTYTNWECIIINDGSTDNTEEIAAGLLKRDPRISYHSKENGGLASARNFGIAKSCGDIIFPFDADDKIHPTYLEKAVKAFEQTNANIVYADIDFFGVKQGLFVLPDYSPEELAKDNMIVGNSFFKKKDFVEAGGYNTNMIYGWEDWNLWISFLKKGGIVFKIPEVLFYYRIKEDSMLVSLQGARKQKMHMQIYLNHPDFFDKYYKEPIEIFPQYRDLRDYNETLLELVDFLKGLMKLKPSAYTSLARKMQRKFFKSKEIIQKSK